MACQQNKYRSESTPRQSRPALPSSPDRSPGKPATGNEALEERSRNLIRFSSTHLLQRRPEDKQFPAVRDAQAESVYGRDAQAHVNGQHGAFELWYWVCRTLVQQLKRTHTSHSRDARKGVRRRARLEAPCAQDCITGEPKHVAAGTHDDFNQHREVAVDVRLQGINGELGAQVRKP
jgi:hypothetical protein